MKAVPRNVLHRWLGGLLCGLLVCSLSKSVAAPGRDPFAPQRQAPCADAASFTLGGILLDGAAQHAWLRDATGRWQKAMPALPIGTTGWRVEQVTAGGVTLAADPDRCPAPSPLRLQWETSNK
ncbi:hypothetical protein CYR55_12725 [Chimaeribacter californicus]|uniref:DUF2531 domain-containing protein n=1 Tax=Chimaeribacter californicus TaxID=2060067 RepID=A0A2N5E4B0_9GAMM|nr:DNA utilization family protein [Chimaeribacter californicus]PLR35830.1 hypothetical protein CYR55_12725 [Chimaeribacter californicus]